MADSNSKKDLAELRREQNRADLAAVLATPEGRRVLGLILAMTNILGPSTAPDPYQTAFNEGMRRVGLWLKKSMDVINPRYFPDILKEQIDA